MRTVSTFLSTALLTLTIGASAFAQTAAPADGAPGRHHRHFDPARITQRFDANQNGRLEVSELPARMQERFGSADTNRDGVIAPEEMQAQFAARRAAMQAQMDTDHDGTVSPEEHQAARAARGAARFARLDQNGDGAITAAEVGAERWTHLGRADANADGRVTREEMQAAHHGRRGEGGACEGHHGPQAARSHRANRG